MGGAVDRPGPTQTGLDRLGPRGLLHLHPPSRGLLAHRALASQRSITPQPASIMDRCHFSEAELRVHLWSVYDDLPPPLLYLR